MLVAGLLVALGGPTSPAWAGHGTLPLTSGVYRIPYADGVDITVNQDNHTHGGPGGSKNRVDLAGVAADEQIVAAASGVIRAVMDRHGDDGGNGDGLAADQTAHLAGFDDSDEHSCQDDQDASGNNIPDSVVTGLCSQYNNYVWIEHPNGEWTKYTHFQTQSVSDLGWTAGMPVEAGDVLGLEGDIGFASGRHLHHEAAVPNVPGTDLTWGTLGGFMNNGQNLAIVVCGLIGTSVYVQGDSWTANPCDHEPPTADAGGPYTLPEGSSLQLDGTGSDDPDGNPLTYAWTDGLGNDLAGLDDPAIAQPTFAGVDDFLTVVRLDVYDQIEQLGDGDTTLLQVTNVAPAVAAVGDTILEGQAATVSATFTDPGTQDTHSATIDWGDGSPVEAVGTAALAAGVGHVYGDDGTFPVTVTVTDDDGGIGTDTVDAVVGNLDPVLALDTSGSISFPGGDHLVVDAGAELPSTADGTDAGSDDLTFTWSTGATTTYFNDGVGPDPSPSPFGTFPFAASNSIDALYAEPGVETLAVTLTDDDGGSDAASADVLVTGTAEDTEGDGWWKHQYGGQGSPQLDAALLAGYLEIVDAASSVFSEQTGLADADAAHAVLSPTGDARAQAEAALLVGWLQFASGAVAWDAEVALHGGTTSTFLALMFAAETLILDGTASDAQLLAVRQDLDRIRHAG